MVKSEQTKIQPFSYINSSITNNEKLKSNKKTQNITLISFDKKSKFKVHDSVITNEFAFLKKEISNSKEFIITKKVSNKSIELMINYMYSGEFSNVDEKDQLSLAALSDFLGNENVSSKLIDNMTPDIGIKYPKDSFSRILVLISFSFLMICAFYAFFQNLAQQNSLENDNLREIINKYKIKYDDLIAYNKKTANKEKSHEDLSLSDFSSENKELITKMGETLDQLKQRVKDINSSSNTDAITLIEKEVKNLKHEIEKKQEIANKKYKKIIMDVRNAKYDEIADANFKYYYIYNDDQLTKMKDRGEREYHFNDEYHTAKYNSMHNTATEKYKEHDHIVDDEKRLSSKIKELQEVKSEWKKYVTKTQDQIDKVKIGVFKNKNPSLNTKRIEALTFLKSLYTNSKAVENHLKDNIRGYFDNSEFYDLLHGAFGNRNFVFQNVMNSAMILDFEDVNKIMKEKIVGQDKLLFYAVTSEDRILGGYLDIPFPDIYNQKILDVLYAEDKNSFIFNANMKSGVTQVHHALNFVRQHFSYRLIQSERDFEFAFGKIDSEDGVFFKFRNPLQYIQEKDNEMIKFGYSKIASFYNYDNIDSGHNLEKTLDAKETTGGLKKFKFVKVFKVKFID